MLGYFSRKWLVLWGVLVLLFPLLFCLKGSSAAQTPFTVTKVYCYEGELVVTNTLSGNKCELDSNYDNVGRTDNLGNCETWREENLGRTLEDSVTQADEFYDGFSGRGGRGVGKTRQEEEPEPPPPPEEFD